MRLFVLTLVLGQFLLGFGAIASAQDQEKLVNEVLFRLKATDWGMQTSQFVIDNLSNPVVLKAVLGELFNDNREGRWMSSYGEAIQILALAKPEYILPNLIECYRAGTKRCNSLALAHLGAYHPSIVLPVFLEDLKQAESEKIRRHALQAIVHLRSQNSSSNVNEKLTVEQHKQIVDGIRDCYENDSDWLIRHDAVKGLMWQATRQQGFEYLSEALKKEKDPRITTQIILVVKFYSGPSDDKFNAEHFEVIKKMALDKNLGEANRATAVFGLRTLGVALKREKDALPALIQIYETSQSDEIHFMVMHDIWAYTGYLQQEKPEKRDEYMKKIRSFVDGLGKSRAYFLEHIEGMQKQLDEAK